MACDRAISNANRSGSMDETRRDESKDNQRRAEHEAREADERFTKGVPRNRVPEQPWLTERERQERWPVG